MRFIPLFLLISLSFPQENFKEFLEKEFKGLKKEIHEEVYGFEEYKKEVEREFKEYKNLVLQEFENFKKEVLKLWDRFEYTDKKKWVEYSEDLRIKKVFNFETGELRIEVIEPKERPEDFIERILKEFITRTKREAFEEDRVMKRIEEKLKTSFRNIRFSTLEDEQILAPVVTGKEKPTQKDIKRAVNNLIKEGKITKREVKGRTVYTFEVKVPPKNILIKARKYKPYVVENSRRWNLDPALIFAIIHTESYFNPFATSYVPAYGLMQIVPQTAGKDVTKFLFGRPILLSPSYLYNAENNIKIGTTYVYLLYYKYFKDVKNPESRLYCTIAAYNTGPGNVAYAFTGTRNLRKAIRVINRMSSEEVYRTLLTNLPYKETRDYLRKVHSRIAMYRNI